MSTAPASPAPGADTVLLAAAPPPPAAADVVVLGGGLAALAVAAGLAEAGASVALLCPEADLGLDESGLCDGQLLLGTHDRPVRLVDAVGAEQAHALLRFSARALTAAHALDGVETGGLELAWNDAEAADLDASVATLERAGVPVARWDAARVAAETAVEAPVAAASSALFVPDGGAVLPRVALATLWRRARAAGVSAHLHAPVAAVDAGGVRLAHGAEVRADVVVFADGWQHKRVEPWFADKLYPVRHQHQLRGGRPPARPWSTQGGYLLGTPRPEGLVVSGARWATPHLEAGETDATVVQEAVSAAQERYAAQRLGTWAQAPVRARWSHVATHTCDNLPIVGPLPGRPSLVACVGWNGRPWSWALAAAAAVTQGLVEGRPSGVPRMVLPTRFL